MANEVLSIKRSTLTGIGNAVRAQTGKSEEISVLALEDEIRSIGTGVDTSDATITPETVFENEIGYGKAGRVVGTFTLAPELATQGSLLSQVKVALEDKAAGGGGAGIDGIPAGYARADYIQFTQAQIVDTGIICNQNTKIQVCFTRERSTQHYMYGVASSDNTASVTAYLGGSWRFGNKSATKTISMTRDDIFYSAIVDNSEISVTGNASTISGVNEFETVGTLTLGGCRSSDGTLSSAQFAGKIPFFVIWQGEEQVRKLVPVVSAEGVYRFFDMVSKAFFDSVTGSALEGGNL